MCRRSFSDDDVTRVSNHGHSVGVQQLTIALAAFTKLEFKTTLLVENLEL